MIRLDTSLRELSKNSAQASAVKALAKLEIKTVHDLLFYFPSRYLDFSKFSSINSVKPGEVVTLRVTVKSIGSRFSFRTRKSLAEAVLSDETGSIKVTWFNMGYLAKQIKTGDELLLSGKVEQYKGLQMINPIHEPVAQENLHTGRVVPIYRMTEGLYQRTIRNLINQALGAANELKDDLPDKVKKENNLTDLKTALQNIHFPADEQSLSRAKTRFSFEEVFIQQLAVAKHKYLLREQKAQEIPQNIEIIKTFLKDLPFELTLSQKKALWDIIQNLSSSAPMNRLIEGDVGSGKTLVALLSAFNVASAGFQSVLLAPTEILAKQHFDSFFAYGKENKINTALLTSHFQIVNNKPLTKAQLSQAIADGEVDIIIGTHALLQSNIKFKHLALVIVDEQHRFGVGQRSFLLKKTGQKKIPHLLSMSATPIPRTLALSFYGDLEISTIKEMPKGRQSISTSIVPENKRKAAYDFINEQIVAGRQVFIVTSRVEENEAAEIKSAKAEAVRLQKEVFPKAKVGLIHGKMSGSEKDKIMKGFNEGKLDVLVATSVIEIGIDVPNATVMVIEDAENFGLAQLHQLRGRVGRGTHKSYCLLFTSTQSEASLERLKGFTQIKDGFKLAEMDLRTRGFGSLFGTEQSGFKFIFSKYLTLQVLEDAKNSARKIINEDSELNKYPQLKKKVDPLLEQIHLE